MQYSYNSLVLATYTELMAACSDSLDGESTSVFRCTNTPMEISPQFPYNEILFDWDLNDKIFLKLNLIANKL